MSPTYEVPLPVRYETADVAPFLLLQPEINLKENQFDEQLFLGHFPPSPLLAGFTRYRRGTDLKCSLFDQIWYFVGGGGGRYRKTISLSGPQVKEWVEKRIS